MIRTHHFSAEERQALLTVAGAGDGVLRRLELVGICTLEALASADPDALRRAMSDAAACACWTQSPKAMQLLQRLVHFARLRCA